MRQVELFAKEQSHLMPGLRLSIEVASMATPLHKLPLTFQSFVAEIPHRSKIRFTALSVNQILEETINTMRFYFIIFHKKKKCLNLRICIRKINILFKSHMKLAHNNMIFFYLINIDSKGNE